MEKKKKKKQPPKQLLTPAKYIQLKARSLPIAVCYINEDWKSKRMADILVARKQPSGNFTVAIFHVDLLCLGVKNATSKFNLTPLEFDYSTSTDVLKRRTNISYNEVHSIIYGALAFAQEEAGFAPHPHFTLAQYLLEENSDKIPLIEYEFGKDGKPFLAVQTRLEASKYLPKLRQRFGDNFPFIIVEDELKKYKDYDKEDIDDEDLDDELREFSREDSSSELTPSIGEKIIKLFNKRKKKYAEEKALTHTTNAYVHPEYPDNLELINTEVEALYNKNLYYSFPRRAIKQLLALSRETLIEDLNQIILYELGKSCDTITDEMRDKYANTITHVLFLLGEIKATESLQTVLEIFRQNDESFNFHFANTHATTVRPTLYHIARNQIDVLLAYMKEPGLYSYARGFITPAVAAIAVNEPERREEIIDWFRQLLRFLIVNVADSSVYDASLAGTIVADLLDINATELLPEIKELYDTKQVDFVCCGKYPEVEQRMLKGVKSLADFSMPDIFHRYRDYEKQWKP